jgi:DNA polymerase III alpha subunit (gram-positive type)
MALVSLTRWLRRHHGPPLGALDTPGFVALDLETTGLDRRRDAIVAFAAIPFVHGRPGPGRVTLVNPGRPLPPASTAIHGVTDAMVATAQPVGSLVEGLHDVLGDRIVVGHGVAFDLAVLARERRARGLPEPRNTALDTLLLAAALHPGWRDFTLESVAPRLGVAVAGRHTADGDAIMAGRLLWAMLPELEARGFRTVPELLWLQRTTVPSSR